MLVFTHVNRMKVNKKKTKIMPFNFTTSRDFIYVVYDTLLLRSDLSFTSHVNIIDGC